MKISAWLALVLAIGLFWSAACEESPTAPERPASQSVKPVIGMSAGNLALSGSLGEAESAGQDLHIWNSGSGKLEYAISHDAPWLDVTPAAGSSTGEKKLHFVKANPAGLGKGSHTAFLTVTCAAASNSPQTIGVTLTLSEQPVRIEVSVPNLTFGAGEGADGSERRDFQVRNSGLGTLRYAISSDAAWLSVAPAEGVSTGDKRGHTASVSAAGLQPGRHTAALTVSDPKAVNSPVRIPVAFDVVEDLPQIRVTATSLSFAGTTGGTSPPPQTVQVWNSGAGRLAYGITSDAAWLIVSPAQGTSDGERQDHQVVVNASGLPSGRHTAALTVSDPKAANGPIRISVALDLAAAETPRIGTSAMSLSFAGRTGGTNPAPQTVQVWNSGAGRLAYGITSDAAWLTVSPSQGTSDGERRDHLVSVNISGLPSGRHSASLTVSAPGAANTPVRVPVVLELAAEAAPMIATSTAALVFNLSEGDDDDDDDDDDEDLDLDPPPRQTIQVWNSGGGRLAYAIASNRGWLSVSPEQGTSDGEKRNHDVRIKTKDLKEGTYTGSLTILAGGAANSPLTIAVTVNVKDDDDDDLELRIESHAHSESPALRARV